MLAGRDVFGDLRVTLSVNCTGLYGDTSLTSTKQTEKSISGAYLVESGKLRVNS